MKTTSQIIELIRAEEGRLTEELREKRAFNEAAWKEYGSELCSTEMRREERQLADKIVRLKSLAFVVEAGLLQESSLLGRLAALEIFISEAESTQRFWQEKINGLKKEMGMLNEIAELAGIKI